jgi:hypothetical protein
MKKKARSKKIRALSRWRKPYVFYYETSVNLAFTEQAEQELPFFAIRGYTPQTTGRGITKKGLNE